MKGTAKIYSAEKMDRLYRAALRVLRETGMRIDHDFFLDAFEKCGMNVDCAQAPYEELYRNTPEFRAPDDVCRAADEVVRRARVCWRSSLRRSCRALAT